MAPETRRGGEGGGHCIIDWKAVAITAADLAAVVAIEKISLLRSKGGKGRDT